MRTFNERGYGYTRRGVVAAERGIFVVGVWIPGIIVKHKSEQESVSYRRG